MKQGRNSSRDRICITIKLRDDGWEFEGNVQFLAQRDKKIEFLG